MYGRNRVHNGRRTIIPERRGLVISFLFLIIILLIASASLSNEVNILKLEKADLVYENQQLRKEIIQQKIKLLTAPKTITEAAPESQFMTFEATAYDLSINSCGKKTTDRSYGLTANGTDLDNKTREEAMIIAVDPNIIPLGSKVEIRFTNSNYAHFSGIYTAADTGSTIKGAIVDIFMGDYNMPNDFYGMVDEVAAFGRQEVKIRIIE